jgi:hypothetical protein
MTHDAYQTMSCSKSGVLRRMALCEPVLQTGVGKEYVGRRVSTGWSACYGSIWNRRPRNAAPNPRLHSRKLTRNGAMALRVRFCGTGVLVPHSKWVGYWLTVTETSAGGGIRSVTSVVFFERIEMRFVQAENMPLE